MYNNVVLLSLVRSFECYYEESRIFYKIINSASIDDFCTANAVRELCHEIDCCNQHASDINIK